MEIIKNGICLQEKQLNERCAGCGKWLILGVYRFRGTKLKHVVQCKNCGTASRVK